MKDGSWRLGVFIDERASDEHAELGFHGVEGNALETQRLRHRVRGKSGLSKSEIR